MRGKSVSIRKAIFMPILSVLLPSPIKKELPQSRLFSIPGFHIGKNGLEKFYEPNLRGEGGALHLEVKASGRPLKGGEKSACHTW